LQFAGQALPLFGLYDIASPWCATFARSVKEVTRSSPMRC
jgi:hypothetical protein